MKTKILAEQPLMLAEVKHILDESKKKDGELSFRAARTHDYLSNIPVLDLKVAQKLRDELVAMNIARLKEIQAAKLVDLLPTHPEDVRLILQSYTLSVAPENRQKIVDAIADATKK